MNVRSVLQAGALYFATVFTCGFALGVVRTLYVLPHTGARTAELIEAPIMLAAIVIAARWIVRRHSQLTRRSAWLAAGLLALALMLLAEFALLLPLRGMSLAQYLEQRDPVSGSVYYALLGLFAVLPALLGQRGRSA